MLITVVILLKKVLSISEIATRISTKLTSVMILCIDILTMIFPISNALTNFQPMFHF